MKRWERIRPETRRRYLRWALPALLVFTGALCVGVDSIAVAIVACIAMGIVTGFLAVEYDLAVGQEATLSAHRLGGKIGSHYVASWDDGNIILEWEMRCGQRQAAVEVVTEVTLPRGCPAFEPEPRSHDAA